jgi:GTP-binding protein EngB required for normal cell division
MRKYQMWILAAVVLISIWMASSFAANNSYEVSVGPQKSDMQRMIDAYERLSTQYLVVVQDNLAHMAHQDRQILERLAAIEKKLDLLSQKLDTAQKQVVSEAKPVSSQEQTANTAVNY